MADNLQRVDGRKLGFKFPKCYPKDDKKKFSYPMNCNNKTKIYWTNFKLGSNDPRLGMRIS